MTLQDSSEGPFLDHNLKKALAHSRTGFSGWDGLTLHLLQYMRVEFISGYQIRSINS